MNERRVADRADSTFIVAAWNSRLALLVSIQDIVRGTVDAFTCICIIDAVSSGDNTSILKEWITSSADVAAINSKDLAVRVVSNTYLVFDGIAKHTCLATIIVSNLTVSNHTAVIDETERRSALFAAVCWRDFTTVDWTGVSSRVIDERRTAGRANIVGVNASWLSQKTLLDWGKKIPLSTVLTLLVASTYLDIAETSRVDGLALTVVKIVPLIASNTVVWHRVLLFTVRKGWLASAT